MRTVKILAGVLAGVLVLAAAALLAVWLLVNPNDYKDQIAAKVRATTGRNLLLKGDIKLAVFPWVALETGPASLGNPPGFGADPFLVFDHAAVRVRVWGLLHRRLEIDRVEVDGLDVTLLKNGDGVGNWQGFGREHRAGAAAGGAGPAGVAGAEGRDADAGAGDSASGPLADISGIRITHARVSYAGVTVQNLNLETGTFGGAGVTPVTLTFDADRGVPGESLNVNAQVDVAAAAPGTALHLAAVNLSGLIARPGDSRPAPWEFTAAAIEVDRRAQSVGVPAFALTYGGAHLTGNVQAARIFQDLNAAGSVTLAPLVLREFAPRLGLVLPKTRDPRALAQLAGGTDFSYGDEGLRLTLLQAQLDDTHVKGSVAWVGEPLAVKFQLAVDTVDVNRYLSAPGEAQAAEPVQASVATAGRERSRGTDVQGTLSVGTVHFAPLDFSNVRVTVASQEGIIHLFPAVAQIDGGTYSGNITLDRRAPVATLSIDEHLSQIDMAQLLAGSSFKGRLSGHGNVNLQATAQGGGLEEFMRSLNGHVDANLTDGAIEGVDLGYEYGRVQAFIKHTAAPSPSNPRRTPFTAAKLSAEITHGVVHTTDFTIATSVLQLTGQGSANLANKAIDFKMLARVLQAPGRSVAEVPLNVTGTYADPKVKADVGTLAKDQLKQKLNDVLKKNGLGGLFSK